ncbi:unnamed protein product [Urochloa humidicola]
MPQHRHQGGAALDEAPSPRPSAAGCYAFLTRSHRAAGGYRRLDSSAADSARALSDEAAAAVRVEVGTTKERAKKSMFHVDPAVLEAGPVRRLLAAAGRRAPGGGVAVAVDALLFEHLLWLAAKADDSAAADDLSEIVEFYSQDDGDDDDDHRHEF